MRKTCLEMVYELAKKDERIFFIGSDLGQKTLNQFKENIGERFLMEGISEANIIGVAAGLAIEGKIVYVNTIASFLTRRCYEQIVLDLCLHNANVRLIGNGGGLVYAPLGPTHMAIEDLSIMRSLPNMAIAAPADANEMKRLMPLTVNHKGPVYIRLAKGYDPILTCDDDILEIGKSIYMKEGKDALIITTGISLKFALKTREIMKSNNISVGVLHVPFIKPFDFEAIYKHILKVRVIVTIEEHSIIGGLGSAVAELISEANFLSPKKFKRIGIPDVFPDDYGSQANLLERFSINTKNLINTINSLLG